MASITKYLLIDDVDQSALTSKLKHASKGKLEIIQKHPEAFDKILESFTSNNFREFDGLLIDLRLNENRKPDQNYAINYRVPSLIQELRSRMIENAKLAPECPFILLSDESNINNYYRKDPTSHDLFDRVISKSEASGFPTLVAAQLVSLVSGYKTIIESRGTAGRISSFEELLNPEGKAVDQRIKHSFDVRNWKVAANEYAAYILKQIINKPGILIDELFVASRLGIDIKLSEDWPKLLGKIPADVKYTGVFNEGWPRWWAQNLVTWWDSLKNAPRDIRNLEGPERVDTLKRKFKLTKLVAAKPIQKDYSPFFWTVCKARNLPLDPINGFMINGEEPLPWQEVEYISMVAALKKENYDLLRVHPLEIPRLKLLSSSLKGKNG